MTTITIDDTPADTEEQTMAMTITQEQLDAMLDEATATGEIRPSASFVEALLGSLGITITPAEPPAEMVKLAREIAGACRPVNEDNGTWSPEWVALAALQHADKAMDEAVAELAGTTAGLKPHSLYGAFKRKIGAGGRDAG